MENPIIDKTTLSNATVVTGKTKKFSVIWSILLPLLLLPILCFCFPIFALSVFFTKFSDIEIGEIFVDNSVPLNYGFDVYSVEQGKQEVEIVIQGDGEMPQEFVDYIYCAFGIHSESIRNEWGVSNDDVVPVVLKLFGDPDLYKADTNVKLEQLYLHGMVYDEQDMRLYIDITAENMRYIDVEYMILHEYTHIMQRYRFGSYGYSIPNWYLEGLAENTAYSKGELLYSEETYLILPPKNHLVIELTLDEVDGWFFENEQEPVENAYATYYYFVKYLIDNYGFEKVLEIGDLSQMYRNQGKYSAFDSAVKDTLGKDIDVLFQEFLSQ